MPIGWKMIWKLVDWPDSIKKLQSNWIGRSTGAEVDFFIGDEANSSAPAIRRRLTTSNGTAAAPKPDFRAKPGDDVLRVYTTRPDTLFGATYMVIAPEHPFVERTDDTASSVRPCKHIANRLRARAIWIAPNWPK